MKINFKGFQDSSLCDRCTYGSIAKTTDNNRTVYCTSIFKYMPQNVSECSDYQSKGDLSKHDMERIAWNLETKEGRIIGFKPPEIKRDPFHE